MKPPKRPMAAFFLSLAFSLCMSGQGWQTEHVKKMDSDRSTRASYVLQDLSWIAGSWQGTGLGGDVEEVWTEPKNDHMFGLFRLHQEDKLVFSEFCSISQTPKGIELRVKHFSDQFVGWEEKTGYVTFRLIEIDEQTAYFDGATFARSGDQLDVYVVIGDGDKIREEQFAYFRN